MLLLYSLSLADYCIQNGQLCVQMMTDKTGTNVTISCKVSNSLGWVGIGTGKTMTNSDMIVAWNTGKQVVISTRQSTGNSEPQAFPSRSLSNPQYAYKDSNWLFSVTRPLQPTADGFKVAVAKGSNPFIWAYNPTAPQSTDPNADFQQHSQYGAFEYNVVSGNSAAESTTDTLTNIHGYALLLLWVVFTPISVILARYFKHIGHKWFIIHSITQFVTIAATTVLGLLMENKYQWKFQSVHEIIGLVIIIIGTLQLCSGFYIHFTYDPSRSRIPISDKAHGIIGFLIWFLSLYQMVSGITFNDDKLRLYIFSALAGIMLLAMLGFQYRTTSQKTRKFSK